MVHIEKSEVVTRFQLNLLLRIDFHERRSCVQSVLSVRL